MWDQERLDLEWTTVNGIREAIRVAMRGQGVPTYMEALNVGRAIDPTLFDSAESILANALEPAALRELRQRADAESQLKEKEIAPVEILDRDIAEYERLQAAARGDTDKLFAKLRQLRALRSQLTDRRFSENQLLIRDTFSVARPLPDAEQKGGYVEYRLPFGRGLRIRLLHPDKPEHLTGADLLYELYDRQLNTARIVLVQYKVWSGKTLSLDARTLRQMKRLHSCVCEAHICEPATSPAFYRLPYCSAFLRPTDRLQSPDARLMSRGLHVPLCVALKSTSTKAGGRQVLRREDVTESTLSQRIFEELFNHGMLGSRPLTFPELETFYRRHEILHPTDHLLIQVQDVPFSAHADERF